MLGILAIMIISTVFHQRFEITFYHQEWYKTATYGFNVTLSDLCAIVLLFSMLMRSNEYPIRGVLPFTILYGIYLMIALVSWISLDRSVLPNPMTETREDRYYLLSVFPLFGIWKVVRFFFTYWVLTQFFTNPKALKTVVYCFGINIILLLVTALVERYHYHEFQVSAGMGSMHILNAFVGMMGMFIFPFIFASRGIIKVPILIFLYVCSFVVIILTVGRTALLAFTFSSFVVWIFAFTRNFTIRNVILVTVVFFLSLAAFAKAYQTLKSRTDAGNIAQTIKGRVELNLHAYQMARDNFLGVGLGNYPAWYTVKYSTKGEEPSSIAHNIYFLTLAELGVLGMITFILVHLRMYQIAAYDLLVNWRNQVLSTVVMGGLGIYLMLEVQDMFHFSSLHNSVNFVLQVGMAFLSRIYIDQNTMEKIEMV